MIIPFFDSFSVPYAVSNDGNKIFHARLRKFESPRRHKGFSIKYVMKGEETYEIDGQTLHVKEGSFLLVNDGTLIQSQIPAHEMAEGLCIYISPKLVRDYFGKGKVLRETVYSVEASPLGRKIQLLGTEFSHSPTKEHQMSRAFYEEMAAALFGHQQEIGKELNRLNCVKESTREELYRRLCIARSYMHENFATEIELDELSQEACLSKFHFIRLFNQAFGVTPHQYLIKLRLKHAQRLLLTSNLKLTEICHHVGLRDLSSFGRRFKRTFGLSPARYRAKHAKSASAYVSQPSFAS